MTAIALDWPALFDVLLRSLAAAWLVACCAFAAFVLARAIEPRAGLLERALASVIAGLWLATAGFHALSLLELYTLPLALAGATVAAALAWLLARGRGMRRSARRELRAWRRIAHRAFTGPERIWVWAFALCALPVLVRPLIVPILGWDALTYHAVKAAFWVQDAGALDMRAPGPWFYYGTRTAGASVITSWALLPFHSDLLATAGEALQWLLLGLSIWALARTLGAREPVASAAAAFAMALPPVRMLIGSGYDEPLMCLCFSAGCTCALRFAATRRRGYALLAFAALGLTLGVKLSFARSSAVVLVFVTVCALRGMRPREALASLGAGTAIVFAVLAPWAFRAWRESGLPLSPLPIKLLGVALGEAPPEVRWLMNRPELLHGGLRAELHTLAVLFGDLGHGREVPTLLALVPLALAPIGAYLGLRARPGALLLLVACIAGDVWTYASDDLLVVRLRYFDTMSRFLLVALLIAIVLSTLWTRRYAVAGRRYAQALRAASVFLLLMYAPIGVSSSSAYAAAGVAIALAAYVALVRGTRRLSTLPACCVRASCTLLLLPALAATRTQLRYALMANDFAIHPHPTYFVDAAHVLDQRTRPLRIALTGGPQHDMDRWFAYPFFGEHLQNRLLYVSPLHDGALMHFGTPALHRAYFEQADPGAWLRRLRAVGVTHVVSFDPPSVELMIMRSNPHLFRRISAPEHKAFGVFELLPAAR